MISIFIFQDKEKIGFRRCKELSHARTHGDKSSCCHINFVHTLAAGFSCDSPGASRRVVLQEYIDKRLRWRHHGNR